MATITSTGTNSGLDINKIITDLMAAERKTPTARLDTKEAALQAKLSGIGTLKGAVSDFKSALAGISSAASFQSLSATASDDSLFSATTTSVAQAGTYDIKITKLAQAQKLVTNNSFSSVSDVVGVGTLTFAFGKVGGSFTAKPSITIDASNNTLAGVRDAINKANIGVRANIVYDGAGYRLSIGSTNPGAANSLKISYTGSLSQLAYDPAGTQNMTEKVAAQDAELTVDGLAITSASNSVVGAVPGVTLNLKKAQAIGDAAATLTVGRDSAATGTAVESFITAYNTLMNTTKTLTAYNATTGEKGALLGDSSVRSITSQVRSILTNTVTGTTGTLRSLTDIGIGLQRDGTLALDTRTTVTRPKTKLQTALDSDPEAVASLFARAARVSDSLVSVNSTSSTSTAGAYGINITTLATQATYTGSDISGSAPFIITTGVNDTVALTVNGKTANITLSQNLTGYSGTALATELQTRINAISTLANAGITVSVGYASSNLTFTTNTYGSSSSLVFGSGNANATLGVSNGATAAGVDVAGTIGGAAATGVGQKLTGAGAAAGIAVDILGGATGSRGTVSLSNGVAYQLDNLLSDFLSSDGLFSNRTEGINKQVAQITDQRAALEKRMTALEARYTAQFQAMDALIGKLNATSTFLAQQFASKDS